MLKKPHFSPIPLLWTGFRLISMAKRMAKNEFFIKKRHIYRLIVQSETAFFVFQACTQATILTSFANVFRSFSIALFFSLPLFHISNFPPLYRLFLYRIVASEIFRKAPITNEKICDSRINSSNFDCISLPNIKQNGARVTPFVIQWVDLFAVKTVWSSCHQSLFFL